MNAQDITGAKHTAADPKNNRAQPSLIERLINSAGDKPNPPMEDIYIGEKPTDEQATIDVVLQRNAVLRIAKTLMNNNVSDEKLRRVADAIFNDGHSMETLQKIAALDMNQQTGDAILEIIDTAKLGSGLISKEDMLAIVAIARASVHYAMTYHGGKIKIAYHSKTPFQAWRVKEVIQEHIVKESEPILVGTDGVDNRKQVQQFNANFNSADIVLWSYDIWRAAIRGCESFKGTHITKEAVDSITPMFWQYDHSFNLIRKNNFNLPAGKYECVGFVIEPYTEKRVQVTFPESIVKSAVERKEHGDFLVTVDDSPEFLKACTDARTAIDSGDDSMVFNTKGISIAIVFMPIENEDDPPEVRFLAPVFEDQEINGTLLSMVLAGAHFLNLKYVAKDNAVVSKKELKQDRHLFKQVRHGKVNIPPIKIINLRRPEVRKRSEAANDKPHRNYTCHFLVDPHWRKQWYPSKKRNEVIRIGSYIKGDMSKPFRVPREKVYKAVR